MSDYNPPKPMLTRSGSRASGGGVATSTRTPAPKTQAVIERSPQLDMESARALVKRIRAKLKGRPRVEDSTAIIRQLRNA